MQRSQGGYDVEITRNTADAQIYIYKDAYTSLHPPVATLLLLLSRPSCFAAAAETAAAAAAAAAAELVVEERRTKVMMWTYTCVIGGKEQWDRIGPVGNSCCPNWVMTSLW